MKKRWFSTHSTNVFIILASLLFLLILLSTQFIAWPEMLTWPYLEQNGFSYYRNIFTVYPPLMLKTLSIFALNGWNLASLKLITYFVIFLNLIIFSRALRRITNKRTIYAACLFLLIIWQTRYEVNGIWFDHLAAPLLLSTYLFLSKGKNFLGSLFFGLSLLTKQTSMFLLIPSLIILDNNKDRTLFTLRTALVVVLGYLLLIPLDNLPLAIQQSILFPLTFMSKHQGQKQLPNFSQLILFLTPIFFTSLLLIRNRTPRTNKPNIKNLSLFYIFSLFFAWPRFELFHLLPSLNFLLLIVAHLLSDSKHKLSILIFAIFLLTSSLVFVEYFLDHQGKEPRFLDKKIIAESKTIKEHIGNESFFTTNTWDHYYYLTSSVPTVNFIYPSTPLYYDYPDTQETTIKSIKSNPPTYILLGKNAYPEEIIKQIESNYTEYLQLNKSAILYKIN